MRKSHMDWVETPLPHEEVRLKEAGNIAEIVHMARVNRKCHIERLDNERYINLNTGEVNIEKYDAFRWIGKVQEDIDHLYPDRLEAHLSYALFCCEQVFQTVHLLNDLRLFLRYKPFTIEQLKLEKIYSFYEEHNI